MSQIKQLIAFACYPYARVGESAGRVVRQNELLTIYGPGVEKTDFVFEDE